MRSIPEPGPLAGLGVAERALLERQGLRALAAGRLDAAADAFAVMAWLFPASAGAQRGLAAVAERRGELARARGHRAVATRLEGAAGAR